MTEKQKTINRFKRKKYKNIIEVMYDFDVSYIGSGAYRDVYRLVNYSLVVKVPIDTGMLVNLSNIEHAQEEIDTYKDLITNKAIIKYLPVFHYWNWDSGLVLVDYCQQIPSKGSKNILDQLYKEVKSLENTPINTEKRTDSDLYYNNVGFTTYIGDPDNLMVMYKQYKFLDLSYLCRG